MTSVRDFSDPGPTAPEGRGEAPQSIPLAERVTTFDERRRGSVASRASTGTMALAQRRIARSNTVKAYHESTSDRPTGKPGAEPGIDATAANVADNVENMRASCKIEMIDFGIEGSEMVTATNATLQDALAVERPADLPCRWVSVNGLSWDVIKVLGNKYGLHRLALEDLIETRTRTKVDWYADHAFAVLTLQKLVRVHSHHDNEVCDCPHAGDDEHDSATPGGDGKKKKHADSTSSWVRREGAPQRKGHVLPRYEAEDPNPKMDGFINAHSTTSEESPITPIRTLHRYEGTQSPEHTAFMERHSALADEDLVVSVEQVAIFLTSDNTIISFFEHSGADVVDPIVDRIESAETMLRRSADASLLLQAIIDAIVDLAIPVKDAYNKARKDLQIDVLTNPDISTSKALHIFTEEIDMLQNLFKPIVNLVNALRDHQSEPLQAVSAGLPGMSRRTTGQPQVPAYTETPTDGNTSHVRPRGALQRAQTSTSVVLTPLAHAYLGDVLDHCITIIQSLEQMDASANNLSSLIFNTVGANTNNFMMILALVTVFFSPLTFISGYFGMNFTRFDAITYNSDAFFWYVAIPSVAVFMLGVSGNIMYRAIVMRLARIKIARSREARYRRTGRGKGKTKKKGLKIL